MINRSLKGVILAVACMSTSLALAAAPSALRVGAAKVEITPTTFTKLEPMAIGGGDFDGVYDPIFVRALVLDSGTGLIAIVAVETIHMTDTLPLRQRIQSVLGIPSDHIIITATHSHSAPQLLGGGPFWRPVVPEQVAYATATNNKIVQAIKLAKAAMQPARMGLGVGGAWSELLPNQIVESEIAGVPVHTITPDGMPEANRDKVLINLHGGAFRTSSAGSSLGESIPIAGYAKMRVVAVLYRGHPRNPFPAAVEDVVAVYKELLKTYKPQHIGIFGASAGGGLTAEVTAKLKQVGLPLPAALGIFSARGDFAREGDTRALFEIGGYASPVPGLREERRKLNDPDYVGKTNPRDPILSPIYSDLHGFPPSLFVSSTRDIELSGTANLHRAFLLAGVDARLVVWEGLPHLFWLNASMPESIEANHVMANFFIKELGK